jgi:hypothetical protein
LCAPWRARQAERHPLLFSNFQSSRIVDFRPRKRLPVGALAFCGRRSRGWNTKSVCGSRIPPGRTGSPGSKANEWKRVSLAKRAETCLSGFEWRRVERVSE